MELNDMDPESAAREKVLAEIMEFAEMEMANSLRSKYCPPEPEPVAPEAPPEAPVDADLISQALNGLDGSSFAGGSKE